MMLKTFQLSRKSLLELCLKMTSLKMTRMNENFHRQPYISVSKPNIDHLQDNISEVSSTKSFYTMVTWANENKSSYTTIGILVLQKMKYASTLYGYHRNNLNKFFFVSVLFLL